MKLGLGVDFMFFVYSHAGKERRQLKKNDRCASPFWQKVNLIVEIYDWVLLTNKNFGVFE